MRDHWADDFVQHAEKCGIPCSRIRYRIGWLETVEIARCRCFIESMGYSEQRHLYFQGVDPDKLSEKGDAVFPLMATQNPPPAATSKSPTELR